MAMPMMVRPTAMASITVTATTMKRISFHMGFWQSWQHHRSKQLVGSSSAFRPDGCVGFVSATTAFSSTSCIAMLFSSIMMQQNQEECSRTKQEQRRQRRQREIEREREKRERE